MSPDVGAGAAAPCPSNTWPSSPSNYGVGSQWYLNDCPNTYLDNGGPDFFMVTQEIGRSNGVQPYCYPDTPGSYAGTSDVVPVEALANGTKYRVWVGNSSKQTYCISPHTDRPGIPHPLDLGDAVAARSDVCSDYEILQPFEQLDRRVYRLDEPV